MYIRSTYSFIMRRAENAGVTVWMAWRTAQRIQAEAHKAGVQPQAVPFDDEEDA